MIKIVTHNYYQEKLIRENRRILLFFWADWCGASRILYPVMLRLNDEYLDTIFIGTVNIDEEPLLKENLGITSTPTILIIKNKKIINKAIGAKPIAFYRKMIKEASQNI